MVEPLEPQVGERHSHMALKNLHLSTFIQVHSICPITKQVLIPCNFYLTPKERRSFFSKKYSNLPFLAQKAKMKKNKKSFFGILTIGSCPRLLGEHVRKVSKTLTARIVRS
jgi:hypothetical protein